LPEGYGSSWRWVPEVDGKELHVGAANEDGDDCGRRCLRLEETASEKHRVLASDSKEGVSQLCLVSQAGRGQWVTRFTEINLLDE